MIRVVRDCEFHEHRVRGYAARTLHNVVRSDITIAIAVDFSTSGEQLTRQYCRQFNRKYIAMDGGNLRISPDRASHLIEQINLIKPRVINFAGNGIYQPQWNVTQATLDEFMLVLLRKILPKLAVTPHIIRSGGQTGIDEAAIKAAQKMQIRPIVTAPKGWMFRDSDKNDICDEMLFKSRFYPSAMVFKFDDD